jgi:hypothetical protein
MSTFQLYLKSQAVHRNWKRRDRGDPWQCKEAIMKMFKAATAALIGASVLTWAGPANAVATIYDLNVYDAAFTGTLGTVTVNGQGTSTLAFDVSLNSNVFFQMTGNGNAHDVFWFDLTPFTGAVTTSISTPNAPGGAPGGDYPTDGQFAVLRNLGGFGQGWSSGYDYGATVSDGSAGGNLDYYTGHLIFSLTANDGTLLNLASATHNGSTVYGGADLRQCSSTNPTAGTCTTGPVGFTAQRTPTQQGGVPEPATWAMMLVGFGFVGAAMRRRKQFQSMRVTYA